MTLVSQPAGTLSIWTPCPIRRCSVPPTWEYQKNFADSEVVSLKPIRTVPLRYFAGAGAACAATAAINATTRALQFILTGHKKRWPVPQVNVVRLRNEFIFSRVVLSARG